MERFSGLITQRDLEKQKLLAQQYASEIPFFEQSQSWKEGMQYQYSPDFFELSPAQLETLIRSGQTIGTILSKNYPDRIIEFRIDFVESWKGQLFLTEVQTDDRGLPAVTQVRNAREKPALDTFPTIPPLFDKSLQRLTNRKDYTMVIVYPEEERFYYSGFYDFAKQIWAENPTSNTVVLPNSQILSYAGGRLLIKPQLLQPFEITPDLLWDFTESYSTQFQPRLTKKFLFELWGKRNKKKELKACVPETVLSTNQNVRDNKDGFILKPVDGRWSKGVVIGQNVPREVWLEMISKENMIAQRFIDPKRREFRVRQKDGTFRFQLMYSRIEGYYVLTGSGWQLADVLVTSTPTIPVHGMKQSIMIPAKIRR